MPYHRVPVVIAKIQTKMLQKCKIGVAILLGFRAMLRMVVGGFHGIAASRALVFSFSRGGRIFELSMPNEIAPNCRKN